MKRDINLLPDKKGGPKKSSGAVVAIVITLVYVLVFGLGILIPKSLENAAKLINEQLEKQIVELQPQVDEYDKLKLELDILRVSIDSTGSIDFSKFTTSEAFDILQSTCPSGIMIERINNSETVMIVDCIASNNYQIAQFVLELERTGYFETINISGSAPADIVVGTNNELETGNTVMTTLNLVYDLSVAEEETDEAGEGDGE